MVDVRYRPAGSAESWLAVVSGSALAVLPAQVTPHTAEAAWRRLAQGGIAGLLEALTGAFGTSLTAIPPFALVVVEEGAVRVAVRGGLELVVESGTGAEEISGRGVSTWVERVIPDVHRVSLALDAGADGAGTLPLADGIAPVSAVVVTVGAVPAAVAAPATAAEIPAESPPPTSDAVESAPEVAPEPEAAPAPEAAPPAEPAPEPEAAAEPEPEPEPVPEPEPAAGAPADDETMITGVPVGPAVAETWLPAATAVPDDAPDDDVVWGETIARPRAAQAEPAEQQATPDAPGDDLGDHDGETIAVADLRAMRQAEREQYESTDNVPPRRPSRGRIRLSTGRVVELERPVVIGRRPKSTRASGADLPTLIAVDSPDQDISRSHIEIRAEGEHVLVTDLDTTNGTVLLRGGNDPVRLHPGEATMVVTGDVLDIGDGITVVFEDLP